MSGRLTASDTPVKGLGPLLLGDRESVALIARAVDDRACLTTPEHFGATLTARGALALADWLYTFARPRSKQVLWGVDGVAKECGVSRGTVYNWARRKDFPRSLPVVGGNGPVWEAQAVKAWVRLARPKGGRPRKQSARRS